MNLKNKEHYPRDDVIHFLTHIKANMSSDELDLVELKNFSFQPNWETNSYKNRSNKSSYADDKDHERSLHFRNNYSSKKHDFRLSKPKSNFKHKDSLGGQRGEFKNNRFRKNYSRNNFNKQNEFIPVVEASFYPDDAQFDTIINALRLTCKTYELFNVARFFLEKPERFVVVIKKIESQEDKNLYLSIDDDLVFLSEDDVVKYILEHHIEKYFDIQEEEVESPKGTFICVNKCGITGRILCPPNYHKYQEILLEHYNTFLPRMSFMRFKDSIETITDQTMIDEWKTNASKIKVYVPKVEGCETRLLKFSDVKRFFLENFKDKAIKISDSFRITGAAFQDMPKGLLSKSIFTLLLREKKFPLNFANNLRGKLRRARFTIYKVTLGKSKIACTCAVKRKFRSIDDTFEENIQTIIDFIDTHKGVKSSEIYKLMYPDAPEHVIGESDEKFSAFVNNLNWLIHEGYVSEFENGNLAATAILTKEQLEAMKKSDITVESNENLVESIADNNQADKSFSPEVLLTEIQSTASKADNQDTKIKSGSDE